MFIKIHIIPGLNILQMKPIMNFYLQLEIVRNGWWQLQTKYIIIIQIKKGLSSNHHFNNNLIMQNGLVEAKILKILGIYLFDYKKI